MDRELKEIKMALLKTQAELIMLKERVNVLENEARGTDALSKARSNK